MLRHLLLVMAGPAGREWPSLVFVWGKGESGGGCSKAVLWAPAPHQEGQEGDRLEPPSLQQWLEVKDAWWCRGLDPGESQWMPGCLSRALSHVDTFPW